MKLRDPATNRGIDPDWSCYGRQVQPDSAAARSVQFALSIGPLPDAADLQQRIFSLIEGVSVEIYFGPSTLGAPALTRVFDAPTVAFDVPAGVTNLSARIVPIARDNPSLSLVEIREYGILIAPDTHMATGNFILHDSRTLAANLALNGGMEDPTKALIVAVARDCSGHDLHGARLELVDAETHEPVPTGTQYGEPCAAYTQFALPTSACTFSVAEQPAWMLVNAPVNVRDGAKTKGYRLRIKGRMEERDLEPVVFAEGDVELFPGSVTRVDSLPRVQR
jgi:hypothetical protein